MYRSTCLRALGFGLDHDCGFAVVLFVGLALDLNVGLGRALGLGLPICDSLLTSCQNL